MKSLNRGRKIMNIEKLYIELALQGRAHRFYVNNEQEMIEVIKKNDPFQYDRFYQNGFVYMEKIDRAEWTNVVR